MFSYLFTIRPQESTAVSSLMEALEDETSRTWMSRFDKTIHDLPQRITSAFRVMEQLGFSIYASRRTLQNLRCIK